MWLAWAEAELGVYEVLIDTTTMELACQASSCSIRIKINTMEELGSNLLDNCID